MKKRLLLVLTAFMLVGCTNTQNPTTSQDQGTSSTTPNTSDSITSESPSEDVSSNTSGDEATSTPSTSEGAGGDVENLKDTTTVRLHYARGDNKFDGWGAWVWQDKPAPGDGEIIMFEKSDGIYGNYVDVDLVEYERYKGANRIGFIIKQHTPGASKTEFTAGLRDISADRFIDIPAQSANGICDIYLYEGVADVMTSIEQALKDKVVSSDFTDKKTIKTKLILSSSVKEITKSMFHVYENGKEIEIADFVYDNNNVEVTLKKEADITKVYSVKVDFPAGELSLDCGISVFYDDKDFIDNFTYYGDDLGVTFNSDHTRTTFKLWAPISSKVVLNIYESGTPSDYSKLVRKLDYKVQISDHPNRSIEMKKTDQGVWALTLPGNFHGKYYTYSVTNGGVTNELVDPYARTCGVDGLRGQIVDFDIINKEVEWKGTTRPDNIKDATDATVYEAHVRDLTVDESVGLSPVTASYQGQTITQDLHGTFLGLAQTGTTHTGENGEVVKTGLDHIKELGVSHIQLQPIYDYASVDEAEKVKYNWGYDPENYNCLEGSYSTNPYDGLVRVREFKTLMKTLCKQGLNVNMDVVFNHTYSSSDVNFEKIIPGYYHRMNEDGTFSDGAGCGNEMASERYMYRKFVVDSCKFWVGEYNISGFRFDLMELLDTTTMELVYTECAKLYDKVMVYGEPWKGGASLDTYEGTNKNTIQGIKGVAAFNDNFRNAIRGDNGLSDGWIQDGKKSSDTIIQGIWGQFSNSLVNPLKTMNYVSCHDNYALFDQIDLSESNKDATLEQKIKQVEQAQAMVFVSQGISFMHGGEEFLRTKQAGTDIQVHNSYNAGDEVNKFDYELKTKNLSTFNFMKDIISTRNEFKGFRLPTYSDISKALTINKHDTCYDFTIKFDNQEYRVVSNSGENYELTNLTGFVVKASNNGLNRGDKAPNSVTLGRNEILVLAR